MNYTLFGVRIPDWLGDWASELLAVPVAERYTLIWIGVIIGLVLACSAALFGLYVIFA